MTEVHEKKSFVQEARELEAKRLAKLEEWNKEHEAWIKEHGPIPFQVPQLFFDRK
ncbi:MAG TPA: hypothetical protein VK463_16200 [Desulfomonilaceae bacterium]|nr:hypothetical protein [Desulfomonilaceae bacterium]